MVALTPVEAYKLSGQMALPTFEEAITWVKKVLKPDVFNVALINFSDKTLYWVGGRAAWIFPLPEAKQAIVYVDNEVQLI